MPAITIAVANVGTVTVEGQGPYTKYQTGGANGALGLIGYDGEEAVVIVAPETGAKVFPDNDVGVAALDAIITAFDAKFPANTVLPAITGTAQEGQTLTSTNGTWVGEATIAYTRRWLRDGVVIAGATATTYVLTSDDVGAKISVEVTGANDNGESVVVSAETETVIAE